MNRRLTKISKYLSFVLRHHPEAIGLELDAERWASVDQLVKNANANGKSITLTASQSRWLKFRTSLRRTRKRCSLSATMVFAFVASDGPVVAF
mgnify:CR=1 FL=1